MDNRKFLDGSMIGRSITPDVENALVDAWCSLLVSLMESKGLYQNLSIDRTIFNTFSNNEYTDEYLESEFSSRPIGLYSRGDGDDSTKKELHVSPGASPLHTPYNEMPLSFFLPNIHIECLKCKTASSFLSMTCSHQYRNNTPYPILGDNTIQLFTVYYRCAKCRDCYIVYQIVRRGLKIQLTGRSQPYRPKLSSVWPTSINDIIKDAVCAATENDIPAAYYHLRTAIEFYAKDSITVDHEQKIEGTELCSRYSETLDERLKCGFPSLTALVVELSAGLHSRKVNTDRFYEILSSFEDHLKAKTLFLRYSS